MVNLRLNVAVVNPVLGPIPFRGSVPNPTKELSRFSARRRRAAVKLLARLELLHAEQAVSLQWTSRRSFALDRALRLCDAVLEIGGAR